jgi:excisionase family DNA binding protein
MLEATYINVPQAASLLGVKVGTIYKWVQHKRIPFRKHGRLLKFDRRSLVDWSNQQETKAYSQFS